MAYDIIKTVYFLVIFTVPVAIPKKYDVDAEAIRLFGEGFGTVLRRFRRSPDYLKILREKHTEMGSSLYEINMQTTQYIENKIIQRVTEMLGYTKDDSSKAQAKMLRDKKTSKRRLREGEEAEEVKNPVEALDGYDLLHQELSVQDRNRYRDLGFEMAGQMANLIIKGMGPDDDHARPVHKEEHGTTPGASTKKKDEHEAHSTVLDHEHDKPSDKTFRFRRKF